MSKIIEVECPICHGQLFIDVETHDIVKHQRSKKKNFATLEDLLVKEKVKKETTEERFSQAKSLEQFKKKKAEELFQKSLKDDESPSKE